MDNRILQELERLVVEGKQLKETGRASQQLRDWEREEYFGRLARWTRNCRTILTYAGLTQHESDFVAILESQSYPAAMYAKLVGVLQAAKDSIERGFIGTMLSALRAEISASTIDQAQALLESAHIIPAAVLARIVIERWLRDEGQKAGIPNADSAKASVINDGLKQREIFSVPKWRQVQACLDIANSAAHGRDGEFTIEDVRRLVDFARGACL